MCTHLYLICVYLSIYRCPLFSVCFCLFAWCNLAPPAYAPGPKALPKTLDFPMHINTDFVRSKFAGKV